MSRWDPWRGCHRCSEGCRFCYIHKGDAKRGINTNDIVRSDKFNRPIVVGGESDRNARPLNYDWVLSIREQCIRSKTAFSFRQCGTHFIKDGKMYTLNVRDLCSQARKAEIDYEP